MICIGKLFDYFLDLVSSSKLLSSFFLASSYTSLVENVINGNRYFLLIANNFVSYDMGPYNIQFNADRYELERKDDYSVIAKALGPFVQKATISIWPNDPLLSTDDVREIVRDTGIMAIWAEPGLPRSSIAGLPTVTKIDGHDGFYTLIRYGKTPEITASCERVFCSLDDGYLLNILSIYPVTSKDAPKPTLIEDIVSSIHIRQ